MIKTVLFVCIHNSGRSQIAEAFFNVMAKGKAKAISAGTNPSAEINPVVIEAMKEAGIDIGNNKPKTLTIEMIQSADLMITMGCGADTEGVCPARLIDTEDWGLEDPKGKPITEVRKIRDEIKNRVAALISDIENDDARK
ncbi:MAG: arsenate reductase ArsC [Peptococcaceae bacterium]